MLEGTSVRDVKRVHRKGTKETAEREGKKVPHVVVINARLPPSASKL